ncbi:MAG: hypothetical protein AAB719_01240 [Patescibacteria group bacterium]
MISEIRAEKPKEVNKRLGPHTPAPWIKSIRSANKIPSQKNGKKIMPKKRNGT